MRVVSRIPRPRSRGGWLLGLAVAVLTIAGGFAGLYFILFSGSSPAALSLSTASSSAPPALTAVQVPGTWTAAAGSVAGYRVREQLAFLPAPSDAVGRTSAITGTVTITSSGTMQMISAATFNVDVSKLTSDKPMRDDHIRQDLGLQSSQYPMATFELSTPVTLPSSSAGGAPFSISATGALTMHGTTRTVTIPMTARLTGTTIEVVGSITFPFEQFGMTPPSIDGFVSVVDSATMEFDIRFQHS